jgi:hypothetical protein
MEGEGKGKGKRTKGNIQYETVVTCCMSCILQNSEIVISAHLEDIEMAWMIEISLNVRQVCGRKRKADAERKKS